MPTVAVTDFNFPDLDLEKSVLSSDGYEVISGQCRTVDEVRSLCEDADAVITQFAPVRADAIDAMRQAKVIVRYGIGYDNVDIQAAKERSIPVCNIPDYCIDEVADHTLAFVLSLTRQVIPNHTFVQQGKWGLATPLSELRTMRDLTVGVVGFGRIGREVLMRLAPFKCQRLVYDPVVDPKSIQSVGCQPVTLEELLANSDVVSLHCPSNDATRRMIRRETIGAMKPNAMLINLARGDLVDTDALVEALQSKKIAGAALDVFAPEPLPESHPLRSMPNVVTASHIASASPKAVRTLRESAAKLAAMALRGEKLPSVVNGVA